MRKSLPKATAYISLVLPHLECAVASWDPSLVGDCKQLEKVQRWAARFVKQDYRSMTSVSSLISQLGWQIVSGHRRKSRLSLVYKSLHGVAGFSTSLFTACHSARIASAVRPSVCHAGIVSKHST